MLTKAQLLKGAYKVMEKMSKDKKPYNVKVCGKIIRVLPNVFSPKYFTDSKFFAEEVPRLVGGRSLLEIGTGTGVVALCVALKGYSRIVATDINPVAVKNANVNFRKYKLKIKARHGDMFKPLKKDEKFDIIFWNHPFHNSPNRPRNEIEKSGLDYRYKNLKAFFLGAKKHLTPDGEILLGTGNIARINQIKKIARENGYRYKLLLKKTVPFTHRANMKIDLRVYSFILHAR